MSPGVEVANGGAGDPEERGDDEGEESVEVASVEVDVWGVQLWRGGKECSEGKDLFIFADLFDSFDSRFIIFSSSLSVSDDDDMPFPLKQLCCLATDSFAEINLTTASPPLESVPSVATFVMFLTF